jgi:hypothetical protein
MTSVFLIQPMARAAANITTEYSYPGISRMTTATNQPGQEKVECQRHPTQWRISPE